MPTSADAPDVSWSVQPTNNPQVANFTITPPPNTKVTVDFGTDTTYGRSTAPVPAPPGGGAISILVAGMLPSTTYHMRGFIQWQDGRFLSTQDLTFATGPLPAGILPTLTAATAPGGSPSPGVELVNVIDPIGLSVVTDLAGNIVWYYDNAADKSWGGYAFPIRPLKNGNLIASITNLYMSGVPKTIPYNSVLREIDLAGNPLRELSLSGLKAALSTLKTPKGSIVDPLVYSHDVLPLWNGHTILIVQQRKKVNLTLPPGPGVFDVLGDALVDLDENFKPVWVWSAFDYLDPDRHPYEFDKTPDDWDWTHCNCVELAPDGNLVLSTRNQNWVLKLDYQGGGGTGRSSGSSATRAISP
ncbi:MAG: aryl-sulfate sulfotransferase [Thermoanaerobaculia bacterium]